MKTDHALVASLYCIALAFRLVPLLFSPLPFNIDGFPLAKIAQGMTASGAWRLDPSDVNSYNLKMPVYSLLWSAVSQLGGLDVLLGLQFVMPFVTSTVVLPAYLLAVKATRRPVAGFAAGLFIAIFGSFLFVTSAAMKEAVSLVVLPSVVLLFAERADPRKRGLALLLLLLLPFLHHLTTLLALGMVAALVVLGQARAIEQRRFRWRSLFLDLATGPLPALSAWAYYQAVDMGFLGAVTTADAIALFLGITVLLAASLARMRRPVPPRLGRPLAGPAHPILVVPALAIGILLLNERTSVFAGAIGTQGPLLPVLLAVAVLAGFAFVGYQLLRRTANRANELVLAMLVAPTALILFGFLRGLDPLSQALVYRTFDFLDYALAVLAGIGFVAAWSRLRGSRTARLVLAAGFLGALLATTPMVYNSQAVFGVDNVTTPAEFEALAVLASLHPVNVTTDQRLANVASWWFGLRTDVSLPILLRDNASLSGHDYALVLERWTSVGAQEHPAPNVVLPAFILERFLGEHRVVYAAGLPGDRILIVQLVAPAA
ncbi:MAG TPA: hypothetical protein VI999_02475 [Thermoplasmata archaeon]|nr:hypothetical protein [Thermoplasmata archaeon]